MKDLLSAFKSGSYEFKDPWRSSEKSLTLVVPIVAKKKMTRAYVALEEVQDKVKLVDTGGIHGVHVESDVDRPTFIRGGTMLKGATQERAIQFGFLVMPGRSETVLVHCIHASRGIHGGAVFKSSGHVPSSVYSSMLSQRRQSATWSEVNDFASRISFDSPRTVQDSVRREISTICESARSDDLVRTVESLEGFRKDLAEILKKIPDYVDQVGTVIIDPDGVVGLEMYDHPDSWKAFSKSIMKSFSEELSKEDKTGIFKPDMEATLALVNRFLEEIEGFDEEEVFNKDKGRTVILKTKEYVGEYTTLDGKTIHLLVTRKHTEELFTRRIEPIQLRPEYRQPSTLQRFVNWGKRKMGKGTQVVESLRERPKTWTSLRSEVRMSKATLSSRLRELQESGIVEKSKSTNGVTRYSLTGIGQEVLHETGSLNAQTGRFNSCVLGVSKIRTPVLELEEVCPSCGSRNFSVWGFDMEETNYECNDCRHKWSAPRYGKAREQANR
jgi:hypothetical protein